MAAEFQDYYTILGVPKTASEKEIRSAYRKLARKHHPDVNPGDKAAELRFKQINEANEVLSDPEKRKLYDEIGPRWREAQAAGMTADDIRASARARSAFTRSAGGQPDSGGSTYTYRSASAEDMRDMFGDESPFSDFFYDLFGRAGPDSAGRSRRASVPRRGADLSHDIDITLEEAAIGTRRVLQWQDAEGAMRRIEATIPPGVREGSRVKLSGQGLPGTGLSSSGTPAEPGDLYLGIHLAPHPLFELQGNDVQVTIPVELTTAILGGEVTVPTVRGTQLKMKVPPETQNNRVIRLRGQGFPQLNKPDVRGDLLVKVQVVLPTHLSDRERDLFRQLAQLRPSAGEPTPEPVRS